MRSRHKIENKKINEFDDYVVVSAFSDNKDYGANQTKYTLLYKAKKDFINNSYIIFEQRETLEKEDIDKFKRE